MDQLHALGRAAQKLSDTIDSLEQHLENDKKPENASEVVATFRDKVGKELESCTKKFETLNAEIAAVSVSSTKNRDTLKRLELAFEKKQAHLIQYGFKPTKRDLPSYPVFVSSTSQPPSVPVPPVARTTENSTLPTPTPQTPAAKTIPSVETLVSRYAKPLAAPSTIKKGLPASTSDEKTYTVILSEKDPCPNKERLISRYATPKKRDLELEVEEKEKEEVEKVQKAAMIARYSIARATPKLPTSTAGQENIDDLLSRYPKYEPKEFVPLSAIRQSMLPGEDLLERTAMMLNSPLSPVSKTANVVFDDNTPIRFNIGPQDNGPSTPPQRTGPSIQTSTPAPFVRRKKTELDTVLQTPIRLTGKRVVEEASSPPKRAKDSPPFKENRDPGQEVAIAVTPEVTKPVVTKPEVTKPPVAALEPAPAVPDKPISTKPNLESLLAKYRR